MNNELIEKTIEKAKDIFKNEFSGHDYWHTLRVYNIAKTIAKQENCDEEIVCLAALLHDFDDRKITSSTEKLENATAWLEKNNYPEERIDFIRDIISTISFKGTDTKIPESLEGKIVQDADRLDAIGAIGIARVFTFGGNKNLIIWDPDDIARENVDGDSYEKKYSSSSINHFYEKLLNLKDMMNTETAKEIAEKRHKYMEDFLKEFYNEWNGEK